MSTEVTTDEWRGMERSELPDECESRLSPLHSWDLFWVFVGASRPRVLCGYHAQREGYRS